MIMIMKKILFRLVLALQSVPMLVGAATVVGPTAPGGDFVPSIPPVKTVLENVTATISSLFLFGAVIFLVLAGFQYLTSGGDTEKTGKAKTNFIYAVIGIAIGVMAYALPKVISGFVGGGGAL